MGQPVLELRLFGQFDLRLGEVPVSIPSRPAQSLLAYLALTAGTAHRRERLAGLLWPDVEDDSARAGLRQASWRTRKALEARLPAGVQYLLADDLTVAFDARSAYWLDAAALDTPLDEAASVESLQHALLPYRGDLLPGFYDEWVLRERERLEGVFETQDRPPLGLPGCDAPLVRGSGMGRALDRGRPRAGTGVPRPDVGAQRAR